MEKQGVLVGYGRVSTTGQKLYVQLSKLKEYGCLAGYILLKQIKEINLHGKARFEVW